MAALGRPEGTGWPFAWQHGRVAEWRAARATGKDHLVGRLAARYRCSGNVYNFKHDRISSEVVLRISDTAQIPQQDLFNPIMTLSFHSSCAAIAYWINSSGLSNGNHIEADHQAVIAVKQWLVSQANAGNSGVVPDGEVLRIALDFIRPLSQSISK